MTARISPSVWLVSIVERDNPGRSVNAMLGDAAPQPSGGGGGWEPVVLPSRSPVRVWRGRPDLMAMSLPLVFDDYTGERSVWDATRVLRQMWRPDSPKDVPPPPPPVVNVAALGEVVPYQNLDWVITGLEWQLGGATRDMLLSRISYVVTLGEYRPDERLGATKRGSPANRHTARARAKSKSHANGPRTYTVRTGDTLSGIAAKLHVSGGWRALADAQRPPIGDPRTIRVGRVLRVP